MDERDNMDNQEVTELDEFEPVILAQVTAVTGTAPGGTGDPDNVVWGSI